MVTKPVASLCVPVNAAVIDAFTVKLLEQEGRQVSRESYVPNVQRCNTQTLVIRGGITR
jgi:hypothetical protein